MLRQVDGLKLPSHEIGSAKSEIERIEATEALVRNMSDPPRILERGNAAWYRPSDNTVCVPPIEAFISSDHFYATLVHELGNATGNEKRLNRPGVTGTVQFGTTDYSREELVAELTSAFCCSLLGLVNSLVETSASYIQGWLVGLKHDQKAIVIASAQAQRACDRICGLTG